MAYKYAKGNVYRGDIYNEDDTQGNTYLDWNEDAVGIVAGGTTVFVVSGSTAKVGIGTDSPDYTLDVAGNVGVDEYIYHNGDADTYLRFTDDKILLKASNLSFLTLHKQVSAPHYVTVNDGTNNIDFYVKGNGSNGGNPLLICDASTGRVGINGVAAPSYELDVDGDIGLAEYIYHKGDDDTFIRFQDDDITIKAGNVNFINFASGSQNKLIINDSRDDLDFIVRSPSETLAVYLNAANEVLHINHGESNFKTKVHSLNGEALTVNDDGVTFNEDGAAANDFRVESDSNTHMLFVDAGNETVGIGTSSPASTLGVDGSVGAKISSITGTSNTIGATYTILMGSDDGVCAAQLPAAADCTGRIYIFKRLGTSACKVQSNGSEKIENSTDDLELETQYDAYTIQSDGTEWWILGEWYNG